MVTSLPSMLEGVYRSSLALRLPDLKNIRAAYCACRRVGQGPRAPYRDGHPRYHDGIVFIRCHPKIGEHAASCTIQDVEISLGMGVVIDSMAWRSRSPEICVQKISRQCSEIIDHGTSIGTA